MTSAGTCTLRAAVQAADENGGANTIVVPAGTYTYTIPPTSNTDTNDPATGDLDVTSGDLLTITGAGAGSTIINPNGLDRAFDVAGGASLSLSGATVENGVGTTEPDAGYPYDLCGAYYYYYYGYQCGGGIYSDGPLTLSGDAFTGNAAGNTSSYGYGGAVFEDYGYNSTTSTYSYNPLSVSGSTFTGNTASVEGGAIYQDSGGRATLSGNTFSTNSAGNATYNGYGGAVGLQYTSVANLSNNLFSSNTASYEGGGLYNDSYADTNLDGNTFRANSADEGGGLADEDSSAFSAVDNLFTGNKASSYGNTGAADGYGGGLYLDSCTDYSVNHDEFDGNTAGYGGGITTYCFVSSDGSSFINNTATDDGGALYVESGAPFTLTNATISKNTAAYGGGIYFDEPSPVDMINDTIYQNSAAADGQGGGIYDTSYLQPLNVGVENTVIAANNGGDCGDYSTTSPGGSSLVPASADAGYNMDSDGSCFAGSTDRRGTPLLGAPASNGGPVTGSSGNTEEIQTDAELPGSPTIDAGTDSNCPATDARGVARPQGASCDIGSYENLTGAGQLSLSKTAPATARPGSTFTYTITVGNKGPGNSTGTTVTDQLPANTTLQGAGSCTSSGTPAKVTCDLGTIAAGSSKTVTIAVSVSKTGSVTNTASVTNDQGSSASGSATTKIAVPSLGKLVLDSRNLVVKKGRLYAKFTCKSTRTCVFRYSIGVHAKVKKTGKTATVLFLQSKTTLKTIKAGKTVTVSSGVTPAGMTLLKKASHHTLKGKLTSHPRTRQQGIIELISIHLK
jgi:uncharacterized repeat protein (TIGR01451 family)